MYSSAIASSSAVVTPGRIRSASSASVSATILPARPICAISDFDLRTITPADLPRRVAPCRDAAPRGTSRFPGFPLPGGDTNSRRHLGLESPLDLGPDIVDRTVGVHAYQLAGREVVVGERRRLAVVDGEPAGDRLRRVVRPALLGGAAEQAVGGDPVRDLELEHRGQRAAELDEQLV